MKAPFPFFGGKGIDINPNGLASIRELDQPPSRQISAGVAGQGPPHGGNGLGAVLQIDVLRFGWILR
jgi:hypothetical protein